MSTQTQPGSALRAKRSGAGLAVAGFALVALSFVYGLLAAVSPSVEASAILSPSRPGLLAWSLTSVGISLCFFGFRRAHDATNQPNSYCEIPVRSAGFMSKSLFAMSVVWAVVAGAGFVVLAVRLLNP
ncbi:hypothetical protein [Paenarthrobacter nicotinovorans]|uniref:hypothetical protein n=1 Tax=Paenarthrobacter nicotinovorans TaxID=29320 RepID=UPI0007E67F69|nr:hypothetical protein [Paenarthrobacter nicotinovorans]